jgi:hypothetical protein
MAGAAAVSGAFTLIILFSVVGAAVWGLNQLHATSLAEERTALRASESMRGEVVAADENHLLVKVVNRGFVPATLTGVMFRYGDNLWEVPLDNIRVLPSAGGPNGETGVTVDIPLPRSYDWAAIRGSYDKLYPCDYEPFMITLLVVRAVDSETGENVPALLNLNVHSSPLSLTAQGPEYRIRLSDEDHAFQVSALAPGYDNLALSGEVRMGETRVVTLPLNYHPFDLEVQGPITVTRQYVETRSSRIVSVGDWKVVRWENAGYASVENAGALMNNPDFRLTPVYVENRTWDWVLRETLGKGAGEWTSTGRTYTIYGMGPLSTDLPSLPSGYRWVKVSGNWYSATYREEHNRVEELRAQGYRVNPIQGTIYHADAYHWEKTGTQLVYGPWTYTGSVTVKSGVSSLPSWFQAVVQNSDTYAVKWWSRSSPVYTTYYVYSYTLYKRNWRWFPPGWGSWYYAGSGTEAFTSYKGSSFTSGGGVLEDWKKVYSYSYSYVKQTGTSYTYGYDIYTRSSWWADVYGWAYKGRQDFTSPPVSGNGWDYRNVTSEPSVVGYRAHEYRVKAENVLVGYRVEKVALKEREIVIENRVDYWPLPLGEVETEVKVIPRNGFTGEVRLSSSAGTLEGDRVLLGSSPSSVKVRLSPGMTVKIQATDNRGRGLKEGALEVRVNDPAPAPRVTTWTIKENSEVPFDPGSLAQPSSSAIKTTYSSGTKPEVAGYVETKYSPISLAGFPVTMVDASGEINGKPVFSYGALVEATFDPAWILDSDAYRYPCIAPGGYRLVTRQEILDRDLFLYEPGLRPTPESHSYGERIDEINSAVEKEIGRDLRRQLNNVEQGRASLQDLRMFLMNSEGNLRKAVRKAANADVARSRLFFWDPAGITAEPWEGSVNYSGVNRAGRSEVIESEERVLAQVLAGIEYP